MIAIDIDKVHQPPPTIQVIEDGWRSSDPSIAGVGAHGAEGDATMTFPAKSSDVRLSIVDTPNRWSGSLESEFRELTNKFIDDQLAAGEAHRFEQLTQIRRRLLSPRSITQIVEDDEFYAHLETLSRRLAQAVRID